jgi:flagellar hook-basal body complex protein FliE
MPSIDQLPTVQLRNLIDKTKSYNSNDLKAELQQKDFGDTISDFIDAVNESQKQAASETQDIIQGKSQNLHQAMASLEEAKLSFQLMIEIRNKLLESYQELQRMNV